MDVCGPSITFSTIKNLRESYSLHAEQLSKKKLLFVNIPLVNKILKIIIVFSPLYALDSGIGSDFAMDEDEEDY